MSPAEALRERNRRRWRRRRVRRIAAILLLFPLLVAAGLLGGNAVEVFGDDGAAGGASPPRSAAAERRAVANATGAAGTVDGARHRVPITVPVPAPYALEGPNAIRTVRVDAEPRYRGYEPRSHVSPEVRREIARLDALRRERTERLAAFERAGVAARELNVIDAVFRPSALLPFAIDRDDDRWEIERLYVELAPSATALGGVLPSVPEPGTGALVSIGLALVAMRDRGRRRARHPRAVPSRAR